MGYYTDYTLEIVKDKENIPTEVFIKDLEMKLDYNPFDEECRWYEHETDMKKLSLKFPNVVFKLTGFGQDREDIWVKYFNNGMVQYTTTKIVSDKYNAKKLQ